MNRGDLFEATELQKRINEFRTFLGSVDRYGCQPIEIKNGFVGPMYDKSINLYPEQVPSFRRLVLEYINDMEKQLDAILEG